MRSPLRARLLHGVLGALEILLRRPLKAMRLFEAGAELAKHALELLELDLVARDVRVELGDLLIGARKVLALPLDQVLAVLKRLLEPRDLGADSVIAALNDAEALVAIGELDAQLLDRRLGGALRRDGGFERDLLLAQLVLVRRDLGLRAPSSAAPAARR